MNKQTITGILSIVFLILIFYIGAYVFSPGVHPNSKEFILDISYSVALKKIELLKSQNVIYSMNDNIQLDDLPDDLVSNKFHIYFYWPESRKKYYFTLQPKSRFQTSIHLVGYFLDGKREKFYEINTGFFGLGSKSEIEEFENTVLLLIFKKSL